MADLLLSVDDMDGKVEIGQAVYSLPDGRFYTTSRKTKGIPLGYVVDVNGKSVDIQLQGGAYRLTLSEEVNSKRPLKNRFQILRET